MTHSSTQRIVLILTSFPQLSETFIVSKFLGLLQIGWDVHIVCSQSDPKMWSHFQQLTKKPKIKKRVHKTWPTTPRLRVIFLYPIAVIKTLLSNPRGTINYFFRGARMQGWRIIPRFFLDFQIISLKPNLIHFEFGALAINRTELNQLLGCKEIVSFRGFDLNFSGIDRANYYQPIWHDVDGLHFLGEDLHYRAIRRGCRTDKPYIVIPPAIDATTFNPDKREIVEITGTSERPLRILSVGRLEWKKGYEFAFQSIRQILDQGITCEYRIVGDGSYLPALAYARHQLGLEGVIEFLGAQPSDIVIANLKWADVFLHASVSEGFGNSVIEAQAMELPVVCTDADGLSENVEHGVTGFVVPRRNGSAMADFIITLNNSPDFRANMGKAGRARVIKNFQLQDQIDKFSRFYTQIMNRHNAS